MSEAQKNQGIPVARERLLSDDNYHLQEWMNRFMLHVRGSKRAEGILNPRYGYFSLLSETVPTYVYDHPALMKTCDTAFTDGRYVFWNADFIKNLIVEDAQAVKDEKKEVSVLPLMLHELSHIAFKHVAQLYPKPRPPEDVTAQRLNSISDHFMYFGQEVACNIRVLKFLESEGLEPGKAFQAGVGVSHASADYFWGKSEKENARLLFRNVIQRIKRDIGSNMESGSLSSGMSAALNRINASIQKDIEASDAAMPDHIKSIDVVNDECLNEAIKQVLAYDQAHSISAGKPDAHIAPVENVLEKIALKALIGQFVPPPKDGPAPDPEPGGYPSPVGGDGGGPSGDPDSGDPIDPGDEGDPGKPGEDEPDPSGQGKDGALGGHGGKPDQMHPAELARLLDENGLKHVREALDMPDPDDLKAHEKQLEEQDIRSEDAARKARNHHRGGGGMPGSHIEDEVLDRIGQSRDAKLKWRGEIRGAVIGDGMNFEYDETLHSPLFHVPSTELGIPDILIDEGMYIPKRTDQVVIVMVDTSGSVSREMLSDFLSEIRGLAEDTSIQREIVVFSADTIARGRPVLIDPLDLDESRFEDFGFYGRGGTDFNRSINHVLNLFEQGGIEEVQGKKVSSLLYFTDLYDYPPSRENLVENLPPLTFICPEGYDNQAFKEAVSGFANVVDIRSENQVDLDRIMDDDLGGLLQRRSQPGPSA